MVELPQKTRSSRSDGTRIAFSEADYSADAGRVIAHAAATGSAVVEAADGRPRVIISIPAADLPALGG
jgi:hypothetical protein